MGTNRTQEDGAKYRCAECGEQIYDEEQARNEYGDTGEPYQLTIEGEPTDLYHEPCFHDIKYDLPGCLNSAIATSVRNGERPETWADDDGIEYLIESTLGSGIVHLLRGECNGEIESSEDGEECTYRAAFRRMTKTTTKERCQQHTPDSWYEDAAAPDLHDETHTVNLHSECQKFVARNSGDAKHSDADKDIGEDDPGPCGDRAFIAIQHPADDSPNYYCRQHARETWIDAIRVVPNERTRRDDIEV